MTTYPELATVAAPIKWEDVHPTFDSGGYFSTNEQPEVHNRLVDDHCPNLRKVGSIASGGEIPLLVFLKRGLETVAVDHSYQSLGAAYGKIEAIRRLGSCNARSLLTTENQIARNEFFSIVESEAPEPLRRWISNAFTSKYTYNTGSMDMIRREWMNIPLSDIQVARKNLSKLTLMHGDVHDLSTHGSPFDLLYLSNALQYSGREGRITVKTIDSLIRPDGFLLVTGEPDAYEDSGRDGSGEWIGSRVARKKMIDFGWTVLEHERARGGCMAWDYNLLARQQPTEVH